jgi:hypothetical protein
MASGDSEGAVSFNIAFSDLAGNAGTAVSSTTNASSVTFDKTAPYFTTLSRTPSPNSNGWNNVNVDVSYAAADAVSAIDTVVSDPTTATINTEGADQGHLFTIYDLAGNSETLQVTDHTVTYASAAEDSDGDLTINKVNIDKTAPVVGTLTLDPNILWPPDHKMVDITIGGVTDLSGIAQATLSVTDEYGTCQPKVSTGLTFQLEAWRKGNDFDGRVYTVSVTGIVDKAGNWVIITSPKLNTVVVYHDMAAIILGGINNGLSKKPGLNLTPLPQPPIISGPGKK